MNHSNKPGGGGGAAAKSAEAEPCIPMTNLNQENRGVAAAATAQAGRATVGQKIKHHVIQNLLLFLTILGIFCGVSLGIIGRYVQFSTTTKMLITFPGEMLLRVLKMLILPLIVSSLITGLAQLDPKSSGKMGLRALGFYVLTTLIATITGITLALIIRPGRNQKDNYTAGTRKGPTQQLTTLDALLDIIRNMFPENIVQACSQQIGTVYRNVTRVGEGTISQTLANGTVIQVPNVTYEIVRELKFSDGSNVMGLVVFCILFGIFISYSKSEAQILYDFFFVMNELIMKIVAFIMWYSPFGILCLVAGNIIKIENMAETAQRLSIYMLTVILGLVIHSMITVQTLYFLTTRKNPFKFLKGMLQAWLTAVGTASSSATLPITFRCLEENNKVDKRVTRFMLPLGATINMDGTALYQCVATVFIAQLNNQTLSLGQLIAICLASTATSIGVASIPSAALVTMLIVLGTVGLPTEDISYIVTVDWLLDRLRTSINVLGDAYGCGIVEQLSKEELRKLDMEAEREFVQIIAATSGGGGASGAVTAANPAAAIVDSGFFITTPMDKNNQSRSISIHDERKLSNQNLDSSMLDQFNSYRAFDRRPSNRSINSYIDGQPGFVAGSGVGGGTIDHHHLSINQQPAAGSVTAAMGSAELNQPSIVVMDAIRRRSRVLLYNSKLPGGINSMPHISHYDQGGSSTSNNNNNPNV